MKDFFESILGSYKGRYKNKFIGTFFLFYLILSWEKVAVIFFMSDMSYRDFISHWSDDVSSMLVVVCWAFILACLYLAVSPWMSFVVHVAQSKAITEYKIQTLRNERLVFEEKQAMESIRGAALDLEQKNIDSEVTIKETKDVANESDDKKRYLKLISVFSEEKIRNMFSQLEDGTIGYTTYNSISEFSDKLQSIEYHFEDKLLENSRANYAEKIQALVNFLKNNTEINSNGYSLQASGVPYVVGLKELVIQAYRSFFAAGRSLP